MTEQLKWEDVLHEGFVMPPVSRDTPLPDAITVATDAVAKHLLHSKSVRAYLKNIPKGSGTHCPDSLLDELVKYVAIQRGEIDKSNPVLSLAFHEKIIMPVFEFERERVLAALQLIGDIKDDSEFSVFCLSTHLGRLQDIFWTKWFAKVVSPYQSLAEADKKRYEESTRGTLSQYDYTVFDYENDRCVDRKTWALAFPKEVVAIIDTLRKLEETCPKESLSNYFKALRNAYACTEIRSLESVWANVDRVWIKIPSTSRLIPVHGMESGYEHPFCVSPEFRLEVRTAEFRDVITERRSSVIEHAVSLGLNKNIIDVAKQKLGRIDISVFTCAVRSGVNLNFRIAGQAVPNRQDVLAEGGKIFVNSSTSKHSTDLYRAYLKESCAPKTYEALKDFVDASALITHTVDHEYSHPVGCTPESAEALGGDVMKLLEEGKATMLGNLADEYQNSAPENRLRLIALTVARLIRFMRKTTLENATSAAYVRENFVAITTLVESGVMKLTEKGLEVDVQKAQSRAWFEHLKEFCVGVINAYQAHDKVGIRQLTKRYCDQGKDPIAGIIKWVNRA
ncbi:MAG: hypothetical protein Q8R36_04335 [bacterium]|nr:hypothetical protein [bacterium]